MVKLFVNPVTNKVMGYNKIIDRISRDDIIVETAGINMGDIRNLYYENGKLIRKDVYDYHAEIEEKAIAVRQLSNHLKKKKDSFVDDLINGKDMDIARKEIHELEEQITELKAEIDKMSQKHEEDIQKFYFEKYEEEEKNIDFKHYVSLCLLVKDEDEYLQEWIDYHVNLVDHIYILDNESKNPVSDIVASMSKNVQDKITVIDFQSTENTQEDANNYFLSVYGNETKWAIFIDIDEFIVTNCGTLKDILKDNEKYGSILCQWVTYGASGQAKKTSGPVMQRFTITADDYDKKNKGKMFFQTNRVDKIYRYNPVMRVGNKYLYNEMNNKDLFQLNHYYTKSYEEWKNKMKRGSCDPNNKRGYYNFFIVNPDMEYLKEDYNYIQGYNFDNL